MGKWRLTTESLPEKSTNVWVTYMKDGERKVMATKYLTQIKKFLFFDKAEDVIAWMPNTKPEPYDASEKDLCAPYLCNSGECNSGYYNTGHCNSGNYNSADCNSGNQNSAHYNSGDHNSGWFNSGDHNSGECNSGDHNSGDWNTANHSSGCFNTTEGKIRMFNKLSKWTYNDWLKSNAYLIMKKLCCGTIWISEGEMTEEEIERHPEYKVTCGYLRKCNTDEQQKKWDCLSEYDKKEILSLPNFDEKIFYEITGIRVEGGEK